MKALSPFVAAVTLTLAIPLHAATLEREFRYEPSAFRMVERGGWTEIVARSGQRELRPGRPDLPVLAEAIELPEGMRVARVEVIGAETTTLAASVKIAPAATLRPEGAPGGRTTPDPRFYGAAGLQPERVVELGAQGTQRGVAMASLRVSPLRWDAASGRLELARSVRVRLTLEPADPAGRLVRERVVPEWESGAAAAPSRRAAGATLSRLDAPGPARPFRATQLPSLDGSPVAYVIITGDAFEAEFQRLADWKTASGVPAVVRTLSFIRANYPFGVDDADRIRQFIRDAYTRWGTKWVLLAGDTDVIPTRLIYTKFYGGEFIACDMYFSSLEGNWNADGDHLFGEGEDSINALPGDNCDLYPDVWVGRAPVNNLSQAQLFVDKTFMYARTPVPGYQRSLLFFAEVLFPPDWTSGPTSFDGAELAEECLPEIQFNPTIRYARLYQNWADPRWLPGALPETRQAVIDSMNTGDYNIVNHIGHGYRNVMSVGDANLTNGDAEGLTNGNALFNLYATNCTSNAIDFPCIGESFLHAPNGGAVTNIGSSRFDFPSAGREYQREFYRLVYQDSVTAIGELQARQKIPYIGFSDEDYVHRWTQTTLLLLGDPELRVWTGDPRALTVTHAPAMTLGDTTLTVQVQVGGLPFEGARVTLWKDGDDYRSVATDAAGFVTLDFRPDSLGPASLVVTGYDAVPYEGVVTVNPAVGSVLVEDGVAVDDDATGGTSGNANGVWEAGEVVDLAVTIRNSGTAPSAGVTVTLSTASPHVSVLQSTVGYGTVASEAATSGSGAFRISTPADAPDQHEAAFTLHVVDGSGNHFEERFQLTLRAPELLHLSHAITEIAGNGNGIPTAGETVDYAMRLRNAGTGVANGVIAILRNYDGLGAVTDSVSALGDVVPGAEVTGDAFRFSVLGAGAKFEIRVSDSYGPLWNKTIDLTWPATPSTLTLTSGSTSIALQWLPNAATDLFGYNIYRATSFVGPFTKVNPVPTDRVSYYLDTGLTPLTRYYYKVSAVDSSGNESAQTTSVNETTTPPNHTIFPMGMGGNTPSSVALARIYGPGSTDIVAGADILYVWHADGDTPVDADGSGTTIGDFSLEGSYFAAGPAVGDVDGGGLDIVAPTWTSKQLFVFNQDGSVKAGWPFNAGVEIWSSPALGDLDNDGDLEIVVGSNGNRIYAFHGDGTEVRDGDSNPGTLGVFKQLSSSVNFSTPALADVDGNGELDIVYAGFNGQLHAWRPNGQNLPGFPVVIGGNSTASPAIGYLDGPGDTSPEIVFLTSGTARESLYVFQSDGGRRAGFPVMVITGNTSKQPSPALADINLDGMLDIVVAGTDGKIYVFNPNGTLQPAFTNVRYSTLTSSASESSPVVADLNGDGVPDIVMGDENTRLNAFSGTGTQLPGFPIKLNGEVRGTPGLCDCDNDGMSEIVLAGWDTNLYLWDYDFPFNPNGLPAWPQFHHDAQRTGFASGPTLVDAPPPAAPAAPERLAMAPPSPSPVRDRTRIAFGIPAAAAGQPLDLGVYDLLGRRVATLESGVARSGQFSVDWNRRGDHGGTVGGGVYFVRLRVGSDQQSRKLVVLP